MSLRPLLEILLSARPLQWDRIARHVKYEDRHQSLLAGWRRFRMRLLCCLLVLYATLSGGGCHPLVVTYWL